MPLESCMLVLDNSEYMRNGDYTSTRFQAQSQAVSTVFTNKTESNPESAVGLMTMAGQAPSLLVTPTNDIGKLLSALNKAAIGGTSDLLTAVQIAQLALKHRENKNQRQRIVVFVGSPLQDTQDSLIKLGKRLRKNNVLVDIVTFGEEGMANDEKLGALIEAAGGGESHLISIPPGPHLLSDVMISSPILFDPERAAAGEGDVGAGMDGEIDANMDPELAMAIRMSLAEAQQAEARNAGPSMAPTTAAAATAPTFDHTSQPNTTTAATLPPTMTDLLSNAYDRDIPVAPGDSGVTPTDSIGADDDEDEDEMLRRAMALSRGEDPGDDVTMGEQGEGDDDDEENEEAAIARAIAMSLDENQKKEDNEAK